MSKRNMTQIRADIRQQVAKQYRDEIERLHSEISARDKLIEKLSEENFSLRKQLTVKENKEVLPEAVVNILSLMRMMGEQDNADT